MRSLLYILITAVFAHTAFAEDEYFPLAVGQEITMTATVVSASGKTSEGVAHQKIEGTVEKDGKTYYRDLVSIDTPALKGEFAKLLRKDEKAAYSIDDGKEGAVEQIEALFPLKVGATWQHKADTKTMTTTVIGLESIEISGKSYEKCWHLHTTSSDGSYTEDAWEAPALGDVKSEVVFGNGAKIILTLKEFKPGK